nr:MAG TPA: hypothetical protein [Caudoviricetes sp.]
MMVAMVAFISFILTYIVIDVAVEAIRRRHAK